MNFITDYSFEAQSPSWLLSGGGASSYQQNGLGGTCVQLHADRLFGGGHSGGVQQTFSTPNGTTPYPISFKVRADNAGDINLVVSLQGFPIATIFPTDVGPGWQLVQLPDHVLHFPTATLLIFAQLPSVNESGDWFIDEVVVGEPPVVIPPFEEEVMAGLDREPIYAALFTRLQSVPNISLFSRRIMPLADVAAGKLPALFMVVGRQEPQNRIGQPTIWVLEAELWLMWRIDASDTKPGASINNTLRDIETALLWTTADAAAPWGTFGPRRETTLGGLVQYAWLREMEPVEGVAEGRSLLHGMVEMKAAAPS